MTSIMFEIVYWDTSKPSYVLKVDNQSTLEVKKGELRTIFNEMEKYARLRFKGELSHKGSKK